MEMSDPAVWGETYDDQFGMGESGRQLGATEISSFSFTIAESDNPQLPTASPRPGRGGRPTTPTGPTTAPTAATSEKRTFSVSKYIDKSSADLFQACCKKSPIAWCIISVRETGDGSKGSRTPYLVVEFQRLHVVSFKWEDLPGDAESAPKMETIEFSYETVLIKYSRQDRSGEHPVVKIKGYDFSNHQIDPAEIDSSLGGGMMEQD